MTRVTRTFERRENGMTEDAMTNQKKPDEGHPCFNSEARHSAARIHLPVAEKCNIQCNFCSRKYDCVNESRPGVTSAILSPFQALAYLDLVMKKMEGRTPLSVIGIAGPGDPFANPEETLTTLELVRERHPEKTLCLATNGLAMAEHVERLSRLKISHVTVTVNSVEPAIGEKIYAWVRYGPRVYRGAEGAALLLERQTDGIKRLKSLGITVKINTVIIPGINEDHAAAVARYCAGLGADIQNCIPLMHAEGSAFAGIPGPPADKVSAIRSEAGKYLRQMSHCVRCRADAAGLIGEEHGKDLIRLQEEAVRPKPSRERPNLAVASMEGLFVNRHLGEAAWLWVFGQDNGKPVFLEQRPTPVPGTGDRRWEDLARGFPDCFAILVSGCGAAPKRILAANGITVIAGEGLITETAGPLFSGRGFPRIYAPRCGVGADCGGTGSGCGA